jgi:hypothetical protein
MDRLIVAISGQIKTGKTTLAQGLAGRRSHLESSWDSTVVSTRAVLRDEYLFHPKTDERTRLQQLGEQLDRETSGSWVARSTARRAGYRQADVVVIVDAVRRLEQINRLAELMNSPVMHIHLHAWERTRRKRYSEASQPGDPSFTVAGANTTEREVPQLGHGADLVINTSIWPRRTACWRARLAIRNRRTMESIHAAGQAVIIGYLVGALIAMTVVLVPGLFLGSDDQRALWVTIAALAGLLLLFGPLIGLALVGPERGSKPRSSKNPG